VCYQCHGRDDHRYRVADEILQMLEMNFTVPVAAQRSMELSSPALEHPRKAFRADGGSII
jgi:hypothetical protein